MREEPAIVRQLKEEEKRGKLMTKSSPQYDLSKESMEHNPYLRQKNVEEKLERGKTVQVSIDYEQRLLDSVEKYEKIFRLSPEAIVLLDKRGNLLDMNERLYDWLGYRPNEVVGKNILDLPFLNKEAKKIAKENFLMRILGKKIAPYELEFFSKNGEKHIGLVRGATIKDEFGIVFQELIMISDITDWKQTEQLLYRTIEQLKQLEFIVNHSAVIAFLWRAAEGWPVEFVSENITLFGYRKEDFLSGRIPFSTIIHQDDLARVSAEVTKHSREGAQEFTQEYRIRTRSGEIRWVEDRTFVRRDALGVITHYQGIIFDITQRKHAEELLHQSEEKLRATNHG